MSNCWYCGRENDDERTSCYECGTEFSAAPRASASVFSRRTFWVALCLPSIGFALYTSWVEFRPIKFDRMTIQGTSDFQNHVVAALSLLKIKSPQAYQTVTNYIRIFAQSRHSGMAASEKPPTSYLHDKFNSDSIEAYAAGIAHESFHSKLYHDFLLTNAWATVEAGGHEYVNVPDKVWTGEAAEKLCFDYQVQVLKEIGAPDSEVAAYSWNPNNRYWEIPFEKRAW